jgi:hypothetical protein
LQERGKVINAKTLLNAFLGLGEKQWSLVELFQQHNNDMEKLVGTEYSPLTLQRFQAGLKHVETFCELERNDKAFPLAHVDNKFIKEFEFYLKTVAKCQHNSAMKHVKALKKIIRIANVVFILCYLNFIFYESSFVIVTSIFINHVFFF